jgi:serine/threonine protein kinase
MAKAQLTAGMTIDGFRLDERLHRGGMADIWRASRPDIDFPIVMKVPLLDFEGDISLIVGFEVEQMIMAELKGPHVPRWVSNGDFAVQPYIVMEHIGGPTLVKSLGRSLSIDEIVGIGTAVAAALSDLHQQDVLHFDLKPANILFRPCGTAVLIDFGLSRHEHLPDLLEEQFHRPIGTPEYMAPEQLLRVRSDKRSDIYALGAILYQLATQRLPFGIPGRMRKVRRRVWRDPTPPRAPIILVAVSLRGGLEEVRHALLDAAASALANLPGARLACVNVMPTSLIAVDDNVDSAGDNVHVRRLVELREWARPLQLPKGKISYHLLESRNVAAAVVDFARSNNVAHLIIGAPTSGSSFGGKVSAQITAEAPCTVTVVRASDEGSRVRADEMAAVETRQVRS